MILIRQAQYRAPPAPTRLRYQKGNRVKGAILRHSRQGAKLQAARNKKLVYVLTTPSPQTKECCDDPSASIAPGKLGTQ